jgi:O-succinylbenzoic acid--CoA ligase
VNPIEYPTVRWARELPDHPAVIVGGRVVPYSEFENLIDAAAVWLREQGVSLGDRVIVSSGNSLEWIIVAHALARLGAVLVPLSTRTISIQVSQYRLTYTPKLILVDTGGASTWPSSIPISRCVSDPARDVTSIPTDIDPDRLFSIVQTSGSEGEPKGVCLTYRHHLASAFASALNLGVQPDDRWLLNLPLDRIGGLAIVMRAAIYGTSVVVHDRFDATATWQSLRHDRITQLSLVATTLRRLLDSAPDQMCPAHVRTVMVGGGPVSVSLIDEARERGFPILPTYGLTETSSQIATLSPVAPESKRYTAGTSLALSAIEIRDDEGRALPCGSEGRIHVRGPMVSGSYWSSDGQLKDILGTEGWFRTNDLGSLDADEYLTVHGRIDNVIISGGEKIHAEEVEGVLALVDAVDQSLVIGIDDPEWGQSPMAFVVLKPDRLVNETQIRTFLSERLPNHKIPRRIMFIGQIPTLPSGKPDRQALRDLQRT